MGICTCVSNDNEKKFLETDREENNKISIDIK